MRKYLPIFLLVITNLYPLFGIFVLKWDVNFILLAYFAETLILVFFASIKMIMSKIIWDEKSAKINMYRSINDNRKYTLYNLLTMMYVFIGVSIIVIFSIMAFSDIYAHITEHK